MTIRARAVVFSTFVLLSLFTFAYSEDQGATGQRKKNTDIVSCGRIELTVISEYVEYPRGGRYFVNQTATIALDGKTTVFALNKNEAHVRKNQYGEQSFGVLSSYQCVKGTGNRDYAFLGYSVGGSCADCEWVDIVDEHGTVLASEKEEGQAKFSKARIKLGIVHDYHEGKWNSLNEP